MISFTEMLQALNETWRDSSRRCRVIAARYYVGAISYEQLKASAVPRPVSNGFTLPALISGDEVQRIIDLR